MFKRKLTSKGVNRLRVGNRLVLKFTNGSTMVCLIENIQLVNSDRVAKLNALDFGSKMDLNLDSYLRGDDLVTLVAMGITGVYRKWLNF